MKTVLIILGILVGLGMLFFLLPAIIAGVIAYFLFTAGHIVWGIICCIAGLVAEIGFVRYLLTGSVESEYESDDSDSPPSGISWPQAFTALYIIDHMRNKDDS